MGLNEPNSKPIFISWQFSVCGWQLPFQLAVFSNITLRQICQDYPSYTVEFVLLRPTAIIAFRKLLY